jgi:hypothetical protein
MRSKIGVDVGGGLFVGVAGGGADFLFLRNRCMANEGAKKYRSAERPCLTACWPEGSDP